MIVAAILRFYNLAGDSVWYDEAVSIRQASLPFREMIRATANDNYPPLHNVALFVSLRIFGVTEFAARLPSVFFDLGTVGIIFLLGRRLFGFSVGLIAAWLLAVSPLHISYAQEARMYAAFAFFATLSMFTLVGFISRTSVRTGLGYVLATALLLYSHFFALFIVAAHNLFGLHLLLAVRVEAHRFIKSWLLAQLSILALFAPWIPNVLDRFMSVQDGFWIKPPALETLEGALDRIAGGDVALVAATIILAGVALRRDSVIRRDETATLHKRGLRYWDKVALLSLWFAVPILVPFLLSFIVQPFFIARYTIEVSPAWQIAVALGIHNWCRGRQSLMVAATALMLAARLPQVVGVFTHPWNHDWRNAVAFLEGRVAPQGRVYFTGYHERKPYLFYARRSDIELLPYDSDTILDENEAVWVVAAEHRKACDDDNSPWAIVERQHFYNIHVCLLRHQSNQN